MIPPRIRIAPVLLVLLAALVAGAPPARAQSVAEVNLVNGLVNSAERALKEDKILAALDALVQAEKLKVPSERINEVLALVIKRRKEMAEARLQKVRMFLNDNDTKRAVSHLKEILEFWPDNEDVLKKLAELGVTVKQLNLKAQQYQKEDFNLLDRLREQIRNVEQALARLADLEKKRLIKQALDDATGYYEKYEKHPAIEIKLNLYRAAWAALSEYEAIVAAEKSGDDLACAAAGARAAERDPELRYGFLGLEPDDLSLRLLFAAAAGARTGNGPLAVELARRLEDLGRGGAASYALALRERAAGRHGEALKLLSQAGLLANDAERKHMDIRRLSAASFLVHYRSLLFAMLCQTLVFGLVAWRTFVFADLALDHELSRFLFQEEREIGYYITRCQQLITRGKWKKAERLAHYILKRNPNVPQARLWTGVCRYRLGDKRLAMKIVAEFLKGAPRHPEGNYYMALLKDDHNQPREALQHLELARGIAGASRKFNMEEITVKDDRYRALFMEYKTAAAEMLGVKF